MEHFSRQRFVSWIESSVAMFASAMAHLALPTASFSSEDYILQLNCPGGNLLLNRLELRTLSVKAVEKTRIGPDRTGPDRIGSDRIGLTKPESDRTGLTKPGSGRILLKKLISTH